MARIVVMDDDADVRHFIQQILSGTGHDLCLAENGLDGMALVRSKATALVVTDLQMPKKTGLQVIGELRIDFPDTKVIALTGAHSALADRAIGLGADCLFFKPFRVADFLAKVEELLSG